MTMKLFERVSDLSPITAHEMQVLHQANELAMFMDTLLSAMRGIQFAQRDTRSVWVYIPDQVAPLGWIGWGDYRDSGTMGNSFVVASRTIANNKYNQHNDQHRMKMANNIDVAVRNAKKHLRPYTLMELGRCTFGAFTDAFEEARREQVAPLKQLREKLFGRFGPSDMNSPLHRELFHLVTTGHQFIDAQFNSDMREFAKLYAEVGADDAHARPNHLFAYVHDKFGEQVMGVVCVSGTSSFLFKTEGEPVYFTQQDESPEATNLIGKLSVLQMLGHGQYVMGVGVNLGDGLFYVSA